MRNWTPIGASSTASSSTADRRAHAGRRSAHRVSAKERVPYVAYGRTQVAEPYAWFDFDNEAGARDAVRRLTAFGHRRIAMISARWR